MRILPLLLLMPSLLLACRHAAVPVTSSMVNLDLSTAPKGKTFSEQGDYLIDSNDVLNLNVQEKPEINGIYRVSPSGIIAVPLIGTLRAKGLTESQLRESIFFKLRPLVPVPRVSVSIVQTNSYVVFFSGKVLKPGTYRLEAKTSLLQGLAIAGGIRSEDVTRVIVIRETADGSKKRYETSYSLVKQGPSWVDNFLLERGDLVLIE